MMRRTDRLATVIAAALGLVGLSGCQTMSSPADPVASRMSPDTIVRGAEPDGPRSQPDSHRASIQSDGPVAIDALTDDPFAPISIDELLKESSGTATTRTSSHDGPVPAGFITPPIPINMAPEAMMSAGPMSMSQAMGQGPMPMGGGRQPWNGGPGGPSGCPTCGQGGCLSLMDNMVIISAFDYFTNAGSLDRERLENAAQILNVDPVSIPNLDPERVGGMIGANAGAPLTHDGKIAYQIGFLFNQAEFGGQGFLTTGIFQRCDPCDPSCGHRVSWGVVYDFMYDHFIGYRAGQVRFKVGKALTKCDEVGGWFTIATNTDLVDVGIRTLTCNGPGGTCVPPVFEDRIEARVNPTHQGHLFWHHVFGCGADGTVFVGTRDDLGGTLLLGGTAQVPLSDKCAVIAGGHWSHDADDNGSFDVYTGIAIYPGCNARVPNSCGSRYLPYQDVANNTFMSITIEPRVLIVEGAQGPVAERL